MTLALRDIDRPRQSRTNRTKILYDDAPGVPAKGLHHVVTDPTSYTTRVEVDALGRAARTVDARNGETLSEYYLYGELRKLTDPDGGETIFGRDSLGRVTTLQTPHFASTVFEQQSVMYDELDQPLLVTRPTTCQIQLRYDAIERLTRRRSLGCTAPVGPPPTAVDDEFGYDARGNLVAMRNADIGLVREYDAAGRLVREIDDRVGKGVAYAHDRAARVTSKILPDGTTIHLRHDPAGRVVGLADPFGDLTQIRYDAAGRTVERASRASGLRTAMAHDALGRLSQVDSHRADGSLASSAAYPSYDAAGNRTAKVTPTASVSYGFDELHRLEIESLSGAPDVRYAYSAAGDRETAGPHDGTAFLPEAFTYTYKEIGGVPTHQLESAVSGTGSSRSFAYNPNGEATQWSESGLGTRTITRDALGRIVAIAGGGFTGSYAYDPLGRRIEKVEQGERILYQHDGDQVAAEYSAETVLEAVYVFGPGIDEPLKIRRGATVAAYHTEGLGSVEAVSDTATGVDLASYEYDAFGVGIGQTGSFENAYTYTGRERDQSGLYYYRGRYYLPEIGRFLSPDPAGLAGGINAYAYVGSNPVNFVDPFGLFQLGWPPGFGSQPQGGPFQSAAGILVGGAAAIGLGALTAACVPCGVGALLLGAAAVKYDYSHDFAGLLSLPSAILNTATGSSPFWEAAGSGMAVGGLVTAPAALATRTASSAVGAGGTVALARHPFADGATHLTTTRQLARFPGSTTLGGSNGLFVAPSGQVDSLLLRAASRADIEVGLGLERGALSGGQLVRIDVADPLLRNLRLPTSGNVHFQPGTGLTTGGLNEGIITSPLKTDPNVILRYLLD